MPKNQNTRVNANTSGTTSINRAAPGVHASPVDRTVVPEISNASQLAEGLKAISPGFGQYLAGKHAKFVESETLAGQQAETVASMTREDFDEKVITGELQPEQSPWFQQAYMRQAGINAGERKALQLAEEYNTTFDMETGDINKLFGDSLSADVEGLNDDDFKVGYLNAVRGAEKGIRADYVEKHIAAVKQDVVEQVSQSIMNTLPKMGTNQAENQQALDQLIQNANDLNVEKQELNSIMYGAVAQYAMSGEGHPEVFDLFKNKGKNGPASLAFTEAYGGQIDKAQRAAEALKDSNIRKVSNQARFDAITQVEDRLAQNGGVIDDNYLNSLIYDKDTNPNGNLTVSDALRVRKLGDTMLNAGATENKKEIYRQFLADIKAGNYDSNMAWDSPLSRSETMALDKMAAEGAAEGQEFNAFKSAIENGRPDGLHSMTPKEQNEHAQQMFEDEMEANGGNEDNAMTTTLDKLKGSNAFPSQVKSLFDTANPLNPEAFEKATNMFRIIKQQHPRYLSRVYTNDSQVDMFESFDSLVTQGGATPEQAAQAVASRTPDQEKAGQRSFATPKMRAYLTNEIQDEFEGFGVGKAKVAIEAMVLNRLMGPDSPPFTEELVEEMIERYDSRTVVIGGTRVDNTVAGVNTESLDDAVQDYLPEYVATMNPGGVPAHRLVPDTHTSASNPTWMVLDRGGNRLPGPNGKPLRLDPSEFARDYRISTGEERAQHEKDYLQLKTTHDALLDEIDSIDSKSLGFKFYGEGGYEDPGYISNMELRKDKYRQLEDARDKMQAITNVRPSSLGEVVTTIKDDFINKAE